MLYDLVCVPLCHVTSHILLSFSAFTNKSNDNDIHLKKNNNVQEERKYTPGLHDLSDTNCQSYLTSKH